MKFISKEYRFSLPVLSGFFILIFCILQSSCEKPSFCEDSGYCDLLMREWEIDSLKIDGIDSLALFTQHPTYCATYKFDIISGNHYLIGYDCNSGSIEPNTLGGRWELLNKENFSFTLSLNSNNETLGPVFRGGSRWSLEELTSQSLKIRIMHYNNKTYEIHFKAK
ncbi:MAG: hypothetical protein POELPBGB_01959 [Bacteroidia bacterium]|nr:hypothetical protein [Bacteroidia bacterium]